MKKFARNMKKAFTITELVIVIAVIAILAAVLIPTFSSVISSARESAAMQECRNALTNYSAEAEKEGVNTTGMVFVNNEYAYVNLSGNLHLLGKLGDMAYIDSDGQGYRTTPKEAGTQIEGFKGQSEGQYYTGGKVIIALTNANNEKNSKTVSLAKNEKEPVSSQDDALHENENLYIYYVVVNETKYVGYFTYEQPKGAKFITDNNTVYSRAFGYVVIDQATANMTLSKVEG